MTREHRAWEMLIRRLDYLNTFGGNRSEMEKTTRIVEQIWDDARHEEEPEDPDIYPARLVGGEMSTTNKSEHVIIEHTNESPYQIPYGQHYCPVCCGEFNTGFRCMKCGRQFSPPSNINYIKPDGWEATDDRRLEQEVLDGRM